ncbi:hypothetical protein HHI36_003349 [Cryptolaemus montrouzieri]|uniref:Vitellogenin n=1 Tax=Cryptolaemus montrouzieri TaxID=559131 RepID=A0ABD2PD42_9CUCU
MKGLWPLGLQIEILNNSKVHTLLTTGDIAQNVTSADTVTAKFSYAALAERCPSRNQAILMDVFDGLSNQDYAEGIATLIDPVNITHISPIWKNRICFFLHTKVIAENLTEIHKQVIIKGQTIPKRQLITKAVRVIISNASADIPNGIIKDELVEESVNLVSEITDIKVDLTW